jgi:hypothetical protein
VTKAAGGLRSAVRRIIAEPGGARRYLSPDLDLEEFFARLRQNDVCYVVLRWFDSLPHVDPGEDIDLLVADQDLAFVRSLMSDRPGLRRTQKFDIYSVSGLPQSDFNNVPYYPPRFAQAVLDRGVWLRDRYRVPSLQDHYDSLAYHAVYHKGSASGLAGGTRPDEIPQTSDHDYAAVLTELGLRLDRPLPPTLDSLDRYLAERDLRPPLDTLERLEPSNPWIHARFFADQPDVDRVWRGLAVFVLRDRAQAQVEVAVRELDRQGFEVLDVVALDPAQREAASHRLRGGNWAQGPWPRSGGEPSTFVIAYDLVPDLDGPEGATAVNRRILRAKLQLRDRLLDALDPSARYNPVHSSDNAGQALDYLTVLGDPDVVERIRVRAQCLVDSSAFPYPVIRLLPGQGRRAQVALVEHPVHGVSVCKVFRPGAARFFERELRARKDLGDLPEVPELLDSGERWLLTPHYVDQGTHVRRPIPHYQEAQLTPAASRALTRFAVALHERGLFLLDLSTHNLISDARAGLKVLDLEFLQEYAEPAPHVGGSYTFHGVPAGVDGYDIPLIGRRERRWGPDGPSTHVNPAFHPAVTGSSVQALLRPHRVLDERRRRAVQLLWYLLLSQKGAYSAALRTVRGSQLSKDVTTLRRMISRRVGRY